MCQLHIQGSVLKTLGCRMMGGSPSLFFLLVFLFYPESLLYAWVSFQQKWVFLNIVLYEMNITLPSAELVSQACAWKDCPTPLRAHFLPCSILLFHAPRRILGSSDWMAISERSCG